MSGTLLSDVIEGLRKAHREKTKKPDSQPSLAVYTILGGPVEGQLVRHGDEGFVLDVTQGSAPSRHVFIAMRHVVLVSEMGAIRLQ